MVIYLEKFINRELKSKHLFKDFLLLNDGTQSASPLYKNPNDQIFKIQKELLKNFNKKLFIKYKNLLKTYYFDLLAPEEWLFYFVDFYSVNKKFNYDGYNLHHKWTLLIERQPRNIKIKPYLPFKENTKISYQRNIL